MTHKKVIFNINGGLGKSIMATAVIEALKKQQKNCEIVVITAYPSVFLNNPNINDVIHINNLKGVWKKHIYSEDVFFMFREPYNESDFLNEKKHLIEIWCQMYDIEYKGEMPKLYFSNSEISHYKRLYDNTDKPILAMQTNGGAVSTPNAYNWSRDMPMPIIEDIINNYKKDYTIVHIKNKIQSFIPNTLQAIDDFRSIAILLSMSSKRILIDSFAQHLSTAMGLESVVLWIGTSPKVFGYDDNKNIVANKFTKDYDANHSGFQKILLNEPIENIPYQNLEDMFNFEDIENNLKLL